MRNKLLIFLLIFTIGCAKPPTDLIKQAEEAVERNPTERAKRSLKALEQEITNQESKFALFQSYNLTATLARQTIDIAKKPQESWERDSLTSPLKKEQIQFIITRIEDDLDTLRRLTTE